MSTRLGWYARRLSKMSPSEVVHRTRDTARRRAWRRRQVTDVTRAGEVRGLLESRPAPARVPDSVRELVEPDARAALVASADQLLDGTWSLLSTPRPDIAAPDWFLDPVTGRRAPDRTYAFAVNHRDESVTGNVKAVWELSRHHHLTVLAAAYWLTEDERFAQAVDRQLRSWWAANPFLTGVHWTSGIEAGVRLLSWVWVRRLLDAWPGVGQLFEHNAVALHQIRWHQEFLQGFPSRGSSANNHLIAEAAGRLAAACAFPWYAESTTWRRQATHQLETAFATNTFASGVNRELATDYHRFVTELVAVAGVEADAAGHPLSGSAWDLLCASFDVAAGLLDGAGRPARQGDGDEGRALVLDDPDRDPWGVLLSCGAQLVGRAPWWPVGRTSVAATLLAAVGRPHLGQDRSTTAPVEFHDAGIRLLRSMPGDGPEIWCRCDGGPHGFLSIAAHAHADALSVEVRHGGVDVLVDPGTYCYHGEPEWRSYFRSTLAHNTVEVDGANQSVEGGPFLWTRHATTSHGSSSGHGGVQHWSASHDGYSRLASPISHQRSVTLDSARRTLAIRDVLAGDGSDARLAFHFGPEVEVALDGSRAVLRWGTEHDRVEATMDLPAQLSWQSYRGSTEPVLGWYSPRFGVRVPSTSLVGTTHISGVLDLRSCLSFDVAGHDVDHHEPAYAVRSEVS